VRLFFALEPPADLAIQISDWRDRQLAAPGRPVPPGNFHITLAFLGDATEQQLERLCLETDAMLSRRTFAGASLALNQVGYWHKPGICWLGPSTWPDSLVSLAGALGDRGTAAGLRRKRGDYSPHLTLYRGCQTPPPAPTCQPDFHWRYQYFQLLESRQGSQGVSYHPLAEWTLAMGD
jgi:RNA 2',3'-cyclic 3'-phosphodiesterase